MYWISTQNLNRLHIFNYNRSQILSLYENAWHEQALTLMQYQVYEGSYVLVVCCLI